MSSNGLSISVNGLGKAYNIAHNANRATSAAEAIVQRVRNPLKRAETEEFWALRDVNFDVRPGEIVGLIGRNGAGKSTLLKVLSRITEPTTGSATLYGRVGSLLEVGTGFHPELTGRENIYLNGSILGMRRSEIVRQFDAIVDFSGTEQFLDTPVKRYSSGMYVRLAFAVAAHLNPEILIVDEVLAVGDAAFQKKCLGKMQDVAREDGRTVLFVSHAMNSVLQLCTRCVYMKNGTVYSDGSPVEIVNQYISEGVSNTAEQVWMPEVAPGNEVGRILATRIRNAKDNTVTGDLKLSDDVVLEMDFEVLQGGYSVQPVFHMHDTQNVCVFSNACVDNLEWSSRLYEPGLYRARCVMPAHLFNDRAFKVTPILVRDSCAVLAKVDTALHFELHDDGSGRGEYVGGIDGLLRPNFDWQFQKIEANQLTTVNGGIK